MSYDPSIRGSRSSSDSSLVMYLDYLILQAYFNFIARTFIFSEILSITYAILLLLLLVVSFLYKLLLLLRWVLVLSSFSSLIPGTPSLLEADYSTTSYFTSQIISFSKLSSLKKDSIIPSKFNWLESCKRVSLLFNRRLLNDTFTSSVRAYPVATII